MSFILDVETENAPEFKSLPEGEYEVRIISAEMKDSSKGDPMILLRLDIPAEPYSKEIMMAIMLPNDKDDEKKKAQKLNRLKNFKAAFNLPPTGSISSEDMEGTRAWAVLVEEDNGEYGMQNRIKSLILPK